MSDSVLNATTTQKGSLVVVAAPPSSASRCSPHPVPAPVVGILFAGQSGRTSRGYRWCTCRARRRSWSTTLPTVLTRPWTGSGQSCSVWWCVSYFVTRVNYFISVVHLTIFSFQFYLVNLCIILSFLVHYYISIFSIEFNKCFPFPSYILHHTLTKVDS